MLGDHPFRLHENPNPGAPGLVVLPEAGYRRARREITGWPVYAPTPLIDLPEAARALGLARVAWKDESARFGLKSCKALGGGYAVLRCVQAELARRGVAASASAAQLEAGEFAAAARRITVTCASDGHHDRSVAWGAQHFGAACVIFVHAGVSQGRRDAIVRWGAALREVAGTSDHAVRAAREVAEREGWCVISDTSYPGYTEPARDVMQGYRLMADEALAQFGPRAPSHAFVPGGVGGVAAAVSVQLRAAHGVGATRLVVVEPERAACLLESAEAGELRAVRGELDTVMAGLACGEPSLLAWQELERAASAFLAVPDAAVPEAMRWLAGRGVEAGESAVAALIGLVLAARQGALGLRSGSEVLLFGTEGATDPEVYATFTASRV